MDAGPAGRTAQPRPSGPRTPREHARRLALDVLPPVVTRAVRRYRAAQRAKAGGTAQSRP
ncbi:hypothetical protein [Streptomyces sp. DHE17-7]|uniref:hypothetical protein n=1 Tax=Streptomyces sp. DHE17-7 TaxID=2759949 RepID=UPI0022EAFC5D|nr:hypothetical protein [Streptomyces sp. DHE17-7]MBJ6621166.1 hypothetical protein [Streptomyces sp. DHE17-7]